MYLLGIDPGGTTAVVGLHDGRINLAVEYTLDPARADSVPTALHEIALLLQGLKAYEPVVAIENFIGAGPRSAHAGPTLQVIGFVRGYCRLIGYDVLLQNPQEKLSCMKPAKEMWREYACLYNYHYRTGKSDHPIDALAHALRAREALTSGKR